MCQFAIALYLDLLRLPRVIAPHAWQCMHPVQGSGPTEQYTQCTALPSEASSSRANMQG